MCIDIANAFVKSNYEVRLYTGDVQPTYSDLDTNINVSLLTRYRRTKTFQRLFTWILFFLEAFLRLLFSERSRRLLIVSNPPFNFLLGYCMKKFKKQSFELLIYDVYPDIVVKRAFFSNTSKVVRAWHHLNKKVFSQASRIITIGDGMRTVLDKYIDSTRVEVVPCWVNSKEIRPIIPKKENWFAQEFDQADKFTVLYSGNMGESHDFEPLLEAAMQLRMDDKIHFMIVGDGVKKSTIEDFISMQSLTNITLLPSQDPEVLPYSMACGDIGFVTTARYLGNFMIPSKIFYYLAAGNYVLSISENGSEIDRLLQDSRIGYNIDHRETRDLARLIRTAMHKCDREQKLTSAALASKYTPDLAFEFV
ncbi:MAG: glycosyltransferase family 4 protein [Saprospiraceae bacterium]|nr:glycosyltransferase family 4 protein [Saprospiraceae bacterium]